VIGETGSDDSGEDDSACSPLKRFHPALAILFGRPLALLSTMEVHIRAIY